MSQHKRYTFAIHFETPVVDLLNKSDWSIQHLLLRCIYGEICAILVGEGKEDVFALLELYEHWKRKTNSWILYRKDTRQRTTDSVKPLTIPAIQELLAKGLVRPDVDGWTITPAEWKYRGEKTSPITRKGCSLLKETLGRRWRAVPRYLWRRTLSKPKRGSRPGRRIVSMSEATGGL